LLKSRELGVVLHKAAAFEVAEAKNAKRLLEHDPGSSHAERELDNVRVKKPEVRMYAVFCKGLASPAVV
jgi:hypothetical protein